MNTPREPRHRPADQCADGGRPPGRAGRPRRRARRVPRGRPARRDRADAPAAPLCPLPPTACRLVPDAACRDHRRGGGRLRRDRHGRVHACTARAGAGCRPQRLRAARGARRASARAPRRPGPAAITDATQPGDCPSCATVFKTPSPRSGDHYVVTLSGARVRVTAGVVAVLTGRVAENGSPRRACGSRSSRGPAGSAVADRGHRRHRPARRVQVRDPAADRERGLPRGRTGRRVQRPGQGGGAARTAASWLLALRPPPSHQDEPPRDDDEQEPRDPCGGAARSEGDHHPEHDRQRGGQRPGDPGHVPGRQQPAIGKWLQAQPAGPRATAPGGTDPGGRQLIQVDRGQVGEQRVELAERPCLENLRPAGPRTPPPSTGPRRGAHAAAARSAPGPRRRHAVAGHPASCPPSATEIPERRRVSRARSGWRGCRLFLLARGQHPRPLGGDGHRVLEVRGP